MDRSSLILLTCATLLVVGSVAYAGPKGVFGSHSQLGATLRDLRQPERSKSPTVLKRQPILNRLHALLYEAVAGKKNSETRLRSFVASKEAEWSNAAGHPIKVSALNERDIPQIELYRAQKSIALTRFGRTPEEVTDGFVAARGSIDGMQIAPRDVFYQRWKPIGKPTGEVYVIAPGFLETGRNYHERAMELNRRGADVIIMDQQWAGYTKGGSAGGIDRAFGISRDVAAVTAFASQVAEREYGANSGRQVILMGISMGGGPGVVGALTLNDAGRIKLEGAQMPKGLSGIAESPYFATTPNALNSLLGILAKIPGVNRAKLPALGLPTLTHDKVAQAKIGDHVSIEDIRGQAKALTAATEDLTTLRGLLASGVRPMGKLFILHAEHDPLASPAAVKDIAGLLDPTRSQLKLVSSNNHVFEETPSEQNHFREGLSFVRTR